jgi:hypothetical protein
MVPAARRHSRARHHVPSRYRRRKGGKRGVLHVATGGKRGVRLELLLAAVRFPLFSVSLSPQPPSLRSPSAPSLHITTLGRGRVKQRRRETTIETAAVTRRSDSNSDREPVKRFAISASKPQHIRVKYRIRVYTNHASIQRQRAMSVGRCLSACIERMCVHERLLHAHRTRCACSAHITMHVLYVFLYASHAYTSYIFS